MNSPPERLNDNADRGQGQERIKRQLGADGDHERERTRRIDDGVGRVHDRRAQQHSHGVQVVGGARHDVAGAVALVIRVAQAFQAREEVVAQIEFNIPRDPDHDPARQVLEDALRRPMAR